MCALRDINRILAFGYVCNFDDALGGGSTIYSITRVENDEGSANSTKVLLAVNSEGCAT